MTNFGPGDDLELDSASHDLAMVSGSAYLPEKVRQRLLTFQGEWWLNPALGVPYYESILGQKNPDLSNIRAVFVDAILGVPGIASISSLSVAFDNATRTYSVTFEAVGDNGETIAESIDL